MNYTQKDLEMFNAIKKTDMGKNLVDLLRRLQSHICDSRSWGPEDSKESANHAAKVIEENLVKKLLGGSPHNNSLVKEFE